VPGRSKFLAPPLPIPAATYTPAKTQVCAKFTVVGHSSDVSTNRTPKLTSPDVVSVTQQLPSGTQFQNSSLLESTSIILFQANKTRLFDSNERRDVRYHRL